MLFRSTDKKTEICRISHGAPVLLVWQMTDLLCLHALESDFPGITSCIENYYTSTPLTYRDYTGTVDGSIYGVVQDITAGPAGRVPHKTKIPNLLLSGQNINSHGIMGVLVGTIVTCSELLSPEKIYKQMEEASR